MAREATNDAYFIEEAHQNPNPSTRFEYVKWKQNEYICNTVFDHDQPNSRADWDKIIDLSDDHVVVSYGSNSKLEEDLRENQ